MAQMVQRVGDESHELESRQEPRLVKALEMVAPGTTLREGLDNIMHARTGGLIIVGEVDDLSFLFSGGIKLEIDYSPALLYPVAKMGGAIVLNVNATKIAMANVQLMPDPTILSVETGTRHRTAERVSKQTDALVLAISHRGPAPPPPAHPPGRGRHPAPPRRARRQADRRARHRDLPAPRRRLALRRRR